MSAYSVPEAVLNIVTRDKDAAVQGIHTANNDLCVSYMDQSTVIQLRTIESKNHPGYEVAYDSH